LEKLSLEADIKLMAGGTGGVKFDREHTIRCLDANKHNHQTTCYYLMLSKLQRNGTIEPLSQFKVASNLPSARLRQNHNLNKEEIAPKDSYNFKGGRRSLSNKRGSTKAKLRQSNKELMEKNLKNLASFDQ